MDFEERLNRITERHEALAQSLELFMASTREFMASTRESIDRLERVAEQSSKENDRRMGQLMETMTRLANIVIVHDQRLDDVDHRPDEIEGKSS